MSDNSNTNIINMTELLHQFEKLSLDIESHSKELESASAALEETLSKIEAGANEDSLDLKAQKERLERLDNITRNLIQKRNTLLRELAMARNK